MNMRISAQAVARTLLSNFDKHAPLSKSEAERIHDALENSGVQDAATRLNAGWSRLLLEWITE